jgi:hypothetical protein
VPPIGGTVLSGASRFDAGRGARLRLSPSAYTYPHCFDGRRLPGGRPAEEARLGLATDPLIKGCEPVAEPLELLGEGGNSISDGGELLARDFPHCRGHVPCGSAGRWTQSRPAGFGMCSPRDEL